MQDEEVLAEFRASKALLEGHFLLSSGRHSAHYLQCARVLMDPDRASRLAVALVAKLPRELRADPRRTACDERRRHAPILTSSASYCPIGR